MNELSRFLGAVDYCVEVLNEAQPLDRVALRMTNTRKDLAGGSRSVGRGTTIHHLRATCLEARRNAEDGRMDRARLLLGMTLGILWGEGMITMHDAEDTMRAALPLLDLGPMEDA